MIVLAIETVKRTTEVIGGLRFCVLGCYFSIGICKPWKREQLYSYSCYLCNVTPFEGGFYFNFLAGCIRTTTQW